MKTVIDEQTLRALIEAGVVREALIVRSPENDQRPWCIQIRYGLKTQTLRSKREAIRRFHTIDTAAKLLYDCGLQQMAIDYG